ncbi:hypothetical protein P4126_33810 [Pseudomonas aeruginosa]|nr:hypothetical protein [Pseudomonas aeruginosa]
MVDNSGGEISSDRAFTLTTSALTNQGWPAPGGVLTLRIAQVGQQPRRCSLRHRRPGYPGACPGQPQWLASAARAPSISTSRLEKR